MIVDIIYHGYKNHVSHRDHISDKYAVILVHSIAIYVRNSVMGI